MFDVDGIPPEVVERAGKSVIARQVPASNVYLIIDDPPNSLQHQSAMPIKALRA
ncbi:MAG: hypothetical protein Q4B54_04890 [Coriobacteriales bacterium]|nr:hypothetical protein [Coriobacteriales bacterium]